YGVIWHGQKSWNGVAILARNSEPLEIRRALPGDADDVNSRYIEATVNGVVIGCLYLPNGNPAPGPKFDYKLRWLDRLIAHAAEPPARAATGECGRGSQRTRLGKSERSRTHVGAVAGLVSLIPARPSARSKRATCPNIRELWLSGLQLERLDSKRAALPVGA